MSDFPARTPHAKIGGVVYFGRMLDKIRAHARGMLPADYQPNLGRGFDEYCTAFLRIPYAQLVERTLQGGTDEELLAWCYEHGRHPNELEIFAWNEFMRKRGWDDDVTATLARRKAEAGFNDRSEIRTMFDFIDADEGRPAAAHESSAPPA